MIKSLRNLFGYANPNNNNNNTNEHAKDKNYSGGRGGASAVTIGATAMGGSRGMGYSSGGTFDYLSSAENTVECFYQKINDLRYYESHALTEKVVGIFRDYISQLWKEGSEIIDIPGEDPELVKALNRELEGMDLLETLMKDLSSVIFYGSVSYEISRMDELDPNAKINKGKIKTPRSNPLNDPNVESNKASQYDRRRDTTFSSYENYLDPLPTSDFESESEEDKSTSRIKALIKNETLRKGNFYNTLNLDKDNITDTTKSESSSDRTYGYESESARSKRISASKSSEVEKLISDTAPGSKRGSRRAEELRSLDNTKLNSIRGVEAPQSDQAKVGDIRSKTTYIPTYRLNKLKHPNHTVVEYHRKYGRRYLIKATERYHIPSNKHQIFYFGNDSMRLAETSEMRKRNKFATNKSHDIANLVGIKDKQSKEAKKFQALGIDPKDPKKTPTRYELMERELSTGSPLFYHHLPKVRELYLKDLVVSILGIKDVIQPDILAMNFEGGTNIDHAQDLCNNLEDLLNKNSDYSIFNSSALNYNDLTKLLIDTVRVLPDIDGKLQSINPLRTTSLQEKIQQIRMESKELERDILSSLGVPVDLFEGQSSKWEVIKRSERLQSRVTYYINTLKGSIRRLAQSIFYLQNDRELKPSDFKVTVFNESELDMASKTNKLQNLTELSQTLLNIVGGAERELAESTLINREAYFNLIKSNLKEIYPEMGDLIDIEAYMKQPPPQQQQYSAKDKKKGSDDKVL